MVRSAFSTRMERGVRVEQVQQATDLCRSRGIQSGMFLMWGYEGEELSGHRSHGRARETSQPDIFFTTVAYPIKGTPYYAQVKDRVVQLRPWSQTSDREFDVSGRGSRDYYQFADQLLRDEVALSRLAKRFRQRARTS